ncbi:hypothetical protein SASPL_115082 [Salvia splendens]|uniref:LOB domain-containing protein n=1 Tax=Salvia splendens TaxID=180675 RepID=A0A8X9A0Y9_SALSN|nr:LOB domain-containing protein 36-like [Salvia splendens]XP_042058652.1 LOB domain-containing protein 36-like [Salvia splendens]XP_042058653.1 LOB domain-containing protein 36-like [Salvia splendens]XP_042058654.1 LOB domain-containing protein 36-like [Salvia splendens]KAG6424662.1 hypothetical protein SASPL_115082 [Salvia splendens]
MSSNSPCAACKCLRRKCTQECVFAPYFPPDNPQKFTNVHKVFGASNVSKLLNELSVAQREDAVNSLAYEAEHRLRDPIYGCVGFISVLQQRLSQVHVNLENAKKELASYIGPSGMAPMLNHPGFVQQHGPQAYQLIPQNVQPVMGMQLVLRDQQHQQQLLIREQDQHQHHHQQQQQQQLMMREQAPLQQHLVAQQQYLEAQQMAREQEMMQQQQHHNRSNDLMRFNSEGGGGGGAVTATGLNQISSGGSGGGGVAMQQQQPSLTLGSSYEASHQQFQHQEQHEHEYEHGQLHPLHLLQLQQLQEYIEAQQDNERRMQKGKGKADPCIGPSC